ncbi:hypothetical protein [Hydrocarboniphaga sp.]|uniref:hypothetical protein n=1 Tax=Hydrocarboniphaga sp. TaxID=2033016 RepID=UPI003D147119
MKLKQTVVACTIAFGPLGVHAEPAELRPDWPGAGQLFVGTNYQPYDCSRAHKGHEHHSVAGPTGADRIKAQ